ncbi:DUF2141 domain-containing protein [Maribacter halichondriae]|uniref:DUF2141 domain-containing protein n=1 Tax=Maribacter halichondriae TaxID=2980554 RepID=UPI0023596FD0|nr:DUF2141 domain-containing protein [Maribacter sp. Hal144]
MKKFALLLGLAFIGFTTNAQDASGSTITVTVENVLSDGGTILAGLHTTDTFMKGAGVSNAMAPAKAGEVTLTFENVQPGDYAIMVMHDKNDNKQMDMDTNGMPQESYAATGEMNMYGPPTFEGAKFEVNGEDQEFRIRF